MDMHVFQLNRAKFPPERLAQYTGQYVAWSPDGTDILASDRDPIALEAAVRETGHLPSEIVISFVPDANESIVGGGSLTT